MRMSKHARLRWRERFAHLDLRREFDHARRPTKGERKKLRAQLSAKSLEARHMTGKYYLVSPTSHVVFVVAPGNLIVTVFPLSGSQAWREARTLDRFAQAVQAR